VLDIGFGDGEALVTNALNNPAADYVGVEVHEPGIGHLLLKLEQARVDNVRVIARDAAEVLPQLIADSSFDRVFLLFPDPWPKKRQLKRRLLAPELLAELARVLRQGGELRFASDDADYAARALLLAQDGGAFADAAERNPHARPAAWPETRYERKALSEDRKPTYLSWRRI